MDGVRSPSLHGEIDVRIPAISPHRIGKALHTKHNIVAQQRVKFTTTSYVRASFACRTCVNTICERVELKVYITHSVCSTMSIFVIMQKVI